MKLVLIVLILIARSFLLINAQHQVVQLMVIFAQIMQIVQPLKKNRIVIFLGNAILMEMNANGKNVQILKNLQVVFQ